MCPGIGAITKVRIPKVTTPNMVRIDLAFFIIADKQINSHFYISVR